MSLIKKSRKFDNSQMLYTLLSSLVEDLNLPFLQIKTSLENSKEADQSEQIRLSADSGLQLIEAYKIALKMSQDLEAEYEPVAIGAVLQEVAQQLGPYAKNYNTEIMVDVSGRLTPVLAHQASLSAALQVLSASMVRAQAAQTKEKKYRLLLGAHRTDEREISAGVFGNIDGLSDKNLRSARSLMGQARQPLASLPPGAASGVLIADMLCSSMWTPLRSSVHAGLHGLATTVPISQQLRFV